MESRSSFVKYFSLVLLLSMSSLSFACITESDLIVAEIVPSEEVVSRLEAYVLAHDALPLIEVSELACLPEVFVAPEVLAPISLPEAVIVSETYVPEVLFAEVAPEVLSPVENILVQEPVKEVVAAKKAESLATLAFNAIKNNPKISGAVLTGTIALGVVYRYRATLGNKVSQAYNGIKKNPCLATVATVGTAAALYVGIKGTNSFPIQAYNNFFSKKA